MPDNTTNQNNDDTGAVIDDQTPSTPSEQKPQSSAENQQQNTMETPSAVKNQNNQPRQVMSNEQENSGNKKFIATIFGVLFLIGGVAAGVFLVQRQQNLEERASSGSECTQAPDCIIFDEPGNAGSESVTKSIAYLDITNKPGEERRYFPGQGGDNCYNVSIDGRDFSWQRLGDGPTCRDVSNIQVWMQDEEASLSASCEEIQAFDDDWNLLSTNQLELLNPGDSIRLSVKGTSDNGTIDKARFRVNSSEWQETTDRKPEEATTFYIIYTIPEDTNDFTVNAQVHVTENDSWY